jgi:hypothetical protein
MSNRFLDTSGRVEHYHPKIGTPEIDPLWADPQATLYISRLGDVEVIRGSPFFRAL